MKKLLLGLLLLPSVAAAQQTVPISDLNTCVTLLNNATNAYNESHAGWGNCAVEYARVATNYNQCIGDYGTLNALNDDNADQATYNYGAWLQSQKQIRRLKAQIRALKRR